MKADDHFDLLERRKHYFVVLENVNIHVSNDQAISSGLFGRLSEERIKLADPTDLETIQKFHQLWSAGLLQDQVCTKFFELALSTDSFRDLVKKWCGELDTIWLRHKWFRAESMNFVNIRNPEQIWLEPEPDKDGKPINAMLEGELHSLVRQSLNQNKNHPWVQKILEDMPRFTPMIMFRSCQKECYMPPKP